MYKSAATLLALALATTHGLPDDGHNVQKKDASKGLRGSVGRKLQADGPVCPGICYSASSTKWSEKCEPDYVYGCKDCRECETTEAHMKDYAGPYEGPLSPKCEPRSRNERTWTPCEVSDVKETEDGRAGGSAEIGGAFTKVCDGACYAAHKTPWAEKCVVGYANGYECSDCRECMAPSEDKGGRGDVCDDFCYGPIVNTFWSKKCKTDFYKACEGCPECEHPAAISDTSGRPGHFASRCDKGPVCKNFEANPKKCEIGYSKKFLCNACEGCEPYLE